MLLLVTAGHELAAQTLKQTDAEHALRKAVRFFRRNVAAQGGYLWRYSADLKRREGEGRASASTAWVQPPGTPSVGRAYLEAYWLTGDSQYLDAARETALALVQGQLQSGGWDYRIEFADEQRRRYAYRVESQATGRNTTTLDDNTTQSALQLLMLVDRTLEFREPRIHQAVEYALASLLKVQYPNGAWPQRFDKPVNKADFPVLKAGYPESWPRSHPKQDYRGYYTFNDNTIADTISTMFQAAEIYGDERCRRAAERAGDFILLAQMPEPQPAWAQQYNARMHPAWARKFEPAAVTGGESQGVMRILLDLYRRTGKRKYLEPIPRALAYLKRSRLPDGRLARFYELKTNRPLYFTKEYELTYADSDLPTHYGFKVSSRLERIERDYRRLATEPYKKPEAERLVGKPRLTRSLAAQADTVVKALDDRGAWVEDGRLKYHGQDDPTRRIIDTRTFIHHVGILARFIAANRD